MGRAEHLMDLAKRMHHEELEAMAAVRQMEAQAKHDLQVAYNEKDTATQEASTVHQASTKIRALENEKTRQIAVAKQEAANAQQIAASAAAEKRHADAEIASVAGMVQQGRAAEAKGEQMMKEASQQQAHLTAVQKEADKAKAAAEASLQKAQQMEQEEKAKAAEEQQAIQEAQQAKDRANSDADAMEEHLDIKENRYLKLGLLLATILAWAAFIALIWSRYKHQELHDHHLNMIVRLNGDKMECQELLHETLERMRQPSVQSNQEPHTLSQPLLGECNMDPSPPTPNKGG
ncbi:unnamed protein product [Symbiodinium pilosum]|uniref:Uncharacterized protein n=1 Tax=Symbiodinium pilosum TaxID=2952 RepID=A0A812TD45_SYMPI|nr:unnamed protein product [Symbiodinium pilosum]